MSESLFETETVLPGPPETVFPFFTDVFNLQAITPPFLHFTVLTPSPITIQRGTLIDYKLRIHGLPMRWRTEITAWDPPFRFVDEQLQGPYRQWIHEHTFAPSGDGTVMRDRVRYKVPGGKIIDRLFVRRDVERIFAYRAEKLRELFRA